MRLKDYVAEIRCDDVVLEEYGTKMEADGKTLSCWIPSEAGKTFSISWKFNRDDASNASQGLTYVDGTVIGKATRAGNKASKIATHSGVDIDDASFRPFTFAPIPLTGALNSTLNFIFSFWPIYWTR
ncbi:hypothetical protein BD410DRAFT_583957 [Rickenella mellea]|uniref:Uncharacterized protein n=1 Tax=Rickenella mellea TaxID=50990 RepID=A0A4Y7PR86_9AGAM|nr:hypothetical protein BD410DRAFT_583957 [Rickenella mellea]